MTRLEAKRKVFTARGKAERSVERICGLDRFVYATELSQSANLLGIPEAARSGVPPGVPKVCTRGKFSAGNGDY
jgi:hypothetical protein